MWVVRGRKGKSGFIVSNLVAFTDWIVLMKGFEAVTSIIFCVALSEYDQVLLEENGQVSPFLSTQREY
jgi:hypothetical protein